MGLGDFVKKTVKKVESVAGDIAGDIVGVVDDDLGESLDNLFSEYGVELALIAAGGVAAYGWGAGIGGGSSTALGKYMGTAAALGVVSTGLSYIGQQEAIKTAQENARRQADYEREVASVKAQRIRDKAMEEGGQALTTAAGTGAFTGARSFAAGTGLGSVLATNRSRALDLSRRILQQGERRAGMIMESARDQAAIGRMQAGLGLLTGATGVYTGGLRAETQAKRDELRYGREKKGGTSPQGTEITS